MAAAAPTDDTQCAVCSLRVDTITQAPVCLLAINSQYVRAYRIDYTPVRSIARA